MLSNFEILLTPERRRQHTILHADNVSPRFTRPSLIYCLDFASVGRLDVLRYSHIGSPLNG
jgi:hypothetical protein